MKKLACLLVLAVVAVAGSAHAQGWEYKVTEVDMITKVRVFANDLLLSPGELEEHLEPLGADGWELVGTLPKAGGTEVLLVFKRPAPVVMAPAAVAPAPAPAPVVAPPVAPAAQPVTPAPAPVPAPAAGAEEAPPAGTEGTE